MKTPIKRSVFIHASPEEVWKHLTSADLMQKWMGDPEMAIEVSSDWEVGKPIVIQGFHHVHFENKGTILQFEPGSILQYDYLSSMSNLDDLPENYTTITFSLIPKDDQTELKVEAENFPTFEIYKHLEFYWNGTLQIIKERIEN